MSRVLILFYHILSYPINQRQYFKILIKNKITGHSITQVIKKEDNYYLVECNTRFGGASTLAYKMGLKSFYWFLCEENGIKFKYNKAKKNLRQIRVKQDIYLEN